VRGIKAEADVFVTTGKRKIEKNEKLLKRRVRLEGLKRKKKLLIL